MLRASDHIASPASTFCIQALRLGIIMKKSCTMFRATDHITSPIPSLHFLCLGFEIQYRNLTHRAHLNKETHRLTEFPELSSRLGELILLVTGHTPQSPSPITQQVFFCSLRGYMQQTKSNATNLRYKFEPNMTKSGFYHFAGSRLSRQSNQQFVNLSTHGYITVNKRLTNMWSKCVHGFF